MADQGEGFGDPTHPSLLKKIGSSPGPSCSKQEVPNGVYSEH